MAENSCSWELAVARAVRTGLWNDALQDHVAACVACQESIVTATGMQALAAGCENDAARADAAWLWRKALLEQRQAEADRTLRALRVVQWMSIPIMVVAVAMLIEWGSTQLQAYVRAYWQIDLWSRLSEALWSLATGTTKISLESVSLGVLLAVAAFLTARPLLEPVS